MVDMQQYADQLEGEFASKVDQMPIRTQKRQTGVLHATQTIRQKNYRENEEL